MIKRHLIVVDDVWRIEVWDFIREILPDNRNGNGVLITLIQIDVVISFQFKIGQNIWLDLLSTRGPLRVVYLFA